MTTITAEREAQLIEGALALDQSPDPGVRARARFIRACAVPLARWVEVELARIKRHPNGETDAAEIITDMGINIGTFFASSIGSHDRDLHIEAMAAIAAAVVLGMASPQPYNQPVRTGDIAAMVMPKLIEMVRD